jgi:hypothetical protein
VAYFNNAIKIEGKAVVPGWVSANNQIERIKLNRARLLLTSGFGLPRGHWVISVAVLSGGVIAAVPMFTGL